MKDFGSYYRVVYKNIVIAFSIFFMLTLNDDPYVADG